MLWCRSGILSGAASPLWTRHETRDSSPPSSQRLAATHRWSQLRIQSSSVRLCIDTCRGSPNIHYVNGPARELHRQRAKGARAVADQINLRCKSKSAGGRQLFVRRTLPAAVRQSICHAHVTRRSWQVARRSAQNSREQVILDEIQCRRRSNVQPDAQRAGYGYQQVGSAVPVAD